MQTVICSQEFITRTSIVFCNSGKHVVFGRIVSGYDVVKAIESTPVDDNDRPIGIVMIAQCGELELKLPPTPRNTTKLYSKKELLTTSTAKQPNSFTKRGNTEPTGVPLLQTSTTRNYG